MKLIAPSRAAGLAMAGLLLAAAPAALFAQEFHAERVKDSESVSFDPTKAYILLETPGMAINLFAKLPSPEEMEVYARDRSEALAKAHAKWTKDHARWVENVERPAGRRTRGDVGEEPIEPTEESFGFPDPEQRMLFPMGLQNRFSIGDGFSLYLHEVTPGEYLYYSNGPVGFGMCACMGSVRFKAEAGKVTALRAGIQLLDERGNPISEVPEGVDSLDINVRRALYVEPVSEAGFDKRIPMDRFVHADLVPVEGLPNWYGGEINRVLPIPGVLDYDRDRLIDLRAQRVKGLPVGPNPTP